jgi:ribonuclease P protein component
VTTPHFVILLYARSLEGPPRLGITAARRIGNAVARNRAKRLIREAFRATGELWPPGVDLVVIVKTAIGSLKLEDVVAEWRTAREAIRRRAAQAIRDMPHRRHS